MCMRETKRREKDRIQGEREERWREDKEREERKRALRACLKAQPVNIISYFSHSKASP